MAHEEIVLGVLAFLASLVYTVVVLALRRRQVSPDARPAHRGFMLWWGGLAVVGVATAYLQLVQDFGAFGLIGARVFLYGLVGLLMAMLAGLAHYLLYLYTGHDGAKWYAIGFYTLMMGAYVAFVELQRPAIVAGEWVYAAPIDPGSLWNIALSLGLVGPPLVAAGAYMALYRKAPDITIRYRIAMVSTGFVLWFGWSITSSLLSTTQGWAEPPFGMQLVSQALGVLTALAVLLAYLPPRFLQARGIQPAVRWNQVVPRPPGRHL